VTTYQGLAFARDLDVSTTSWFNWWSESFRLLPSKNDSILSFNSPIQPLYVFKKVNNSIVLVETPLLLQLILMKYPLTWSEGRTIKFPSGFTVKW